MRPQVTIQVPAQLPLVRADGDWLVEVLQTAGQRLQIYTGSGKVTIEADWNGSQMWKSLSQTQVALNPTV